MFFEYHFAIFFHIQYPILYIFQYKIPIPVLPKTCVLLKLKFKQSAQSAALFLYKLYKLVLTWPGPRLDNFTGRILSCLKKLC